MREGIGTLCLILVLMFLVVLAGISYVFRVATVELTKELDKYDPETRVQSLILMRKVTKAILNGENVISIAEEMAKEEFYNCTKLGSEMVCIINPP